MSIRLIFTTCIFSLLSINSRSQDIMISRKNQVYIEFAGNNFGDPNSSADAGIFSINYGRFFTLAKSSLLVTAGIGPLKAEGYDSIKNDTYPITIVQMPIGILWKWNDRNCGFYSGIYLIGSLGKIGYTVDVGMNSFHYDHTFSWQISPNMGYQLQNKSQHLFCRISYTPKLLASVFSDKYGVRKTVFPLWFGISIGGGW